MRVLGWFKPELRNESKPRMGSGWARPGPRHHRPALMSSDRSEREHTCWDPKDSELCLHRVKPDESLVEARSDTDVQIVRQMWV